MRVTTQSEIPRSEMEGKGDGIPIDMIKLSRIPLIAGLIGSFTVLFTLYRHIVQGLHPPIPTISMSAFRQPESFLFAAGLSSTAGLLLTSVYIIHFSLPGTKSILGRLAFLSAVISALGMVITAVVPLQADIMEVLALPRDRRKMNVQSQTHQAAANIFFLASLAHAVLNTARIHFSGGRAAAGISTVSWYTKCVSLSLACCFITSPLLLFMYPRIISGSRVTVVALNQFGAVLSLFGFYSTYSLDLEGYRMELKRVDFAAKTADGTDAAAPLKQD